MDIGLLERLLRDLSISCDAAPSSTYEGDVSAQSSSSASTTDPTAIAQSIDALFRSAIDDDTDANAGDASGSLDEGATVLLASETPPNVFSILMATLRTKDRTIIKAKLVILKLLAYLIKEEVIVSKFYGLVLDSCSDVFRREESNEVKTHCLYPIKKILRKCEPPLRAPTFAGNASDADDVPSWSGMFSADAFFNVLVDEYAHNKQAKGLRGTIQATLGHLVRFTYGTREYPAFVSKAVTIAWGTLNSNFFDSNKDPDLAGVAGALSCLDRCLRDDISAVSVTFSELWKVLLMAITSVTNSSVARYAHANKAVRFVRNHASLFYANIGETSSKSYSTLYQCLQADKDSLKKYAEDAYLAMLSVLARYCAGMPPSAPPTASPVLEPHAEFCTRTVKGLLDTFVRSLELGVGGPSSDRSASDPPVYLSVKSLAALAPAFRSGITVSASGKVEAGTVLDGASALLVIERLIKTSKHIITSDDPAGGSEAVLRYSTYQLERKSDLLYAASAIALAARLPPSQEFLSFQQDTSIDVVIGYSRLWRRAQGNIHRTINAMIGYLSMPNQAQSGSATSTATTSSLGSTVSVIDAVMSVLMVRTLSRLVPGEVPEATPFDPFTGAADDHLYAVYLPLWEAMWRCGGAVLECTQSSLLRISLRYLQDLDLSYTISGATTSDSMPNNIADQELLLNFISFLESFMTYERCANWKQGGTLILSRFIELSKVYPLVSALYRGIRLLLVSQIDSFEDWEVLLGSDSESLGLKSSLLPYLVDLSLKLNTFQQELLSSALQLVLCPPAVKLLPFQHTCASCIVAIKSDLCVQLAIDALESFVGSPELIERLSDVVPHLNKYLTLSKASSSATDTRTSSGATIMSSDSLALSTLRFLGRLGGYNKAILLDPSLTTTAENESNNAINEGTFSGQNVSIRFGPSAIALGFNGTFTLDGMIPRLLELCRQSGQQLRTTAAECLHSIVVIMIGQSATDPSYLKSADSDRSKFSDMYKEIFPVALTLAVSSEPATRKLFETLMLQLAHLFSSNRQVADADASAYIDVLLNSLTRASESEVLTFATRLIEEFALWCIRQSAPGDFARLVTKSASKLDNVIRKLIGMASHPLADIRTGGVTAMNRISGIVMKESALLSRYSLHIVHALMLSFRFEGSESTGSAIDTCLTAILRHVSIEKGRSPLLQSGAGDIDSNSQQWPRNIQDLVDWLSSHLTSTNQSLRRVCMKAFTQLCPLLLLSKGHSDIRSITIAEERAHIKQYISEVKSITDIFTNLVVPEHIVQVNLIGENSSTDLFDFQSYLKWIEHLDALVDFTAWLLSIGAYRNEELFATTISSAKFVPMWASMREFMKYINTTFVLSNGNHSVPMQVSSDLIANAHAELLRHYYHLLVVFMTQQAGSAAQASSLFKLVIQDVLNEPFLKVSAVVLVGLAYRKEQQLGTTALSTTTNVTTTVVPFLPHPSANEKVSVFLPSTLGRLVEIIMSEPGSCATSLDNFIVEFLHLATHTEYVIGVGLEFHKLLESAIRALKCNKANMSASLTGAFGTASTSIMSGVVEAIVSSNNTSSSAKVQDPAKLQSSIKLALSMQELGNSTTSSRIPASEQLIQSLLSSQAPAVIDFCRRQDDFIAQCIVDFSSIPTFSSTTATTNTSDIVRNWDAIVSCILRILDMACASLSTSTSTSTLASNALNGCTTMLFSIAEKAINQMSTTTNSTIATTSQTIDRLLSWGTSNITILYDHASSLLEQLLVIKSYDAGMASSHIVETATGLQICLSLSKHLSISLCDAKASSNSVCKALKFIPYLLEGTTVTASVRAGSVVGGSSAAYRKQTIEAIEEMVANKFPLDTKKLNLSTASGSEYSVMFRAYLDTFASCGSLAFLDPLLPSFRAGSGHKFYGWILDALKRFVASIDIFETVDATTSTSGKVSTVVAVIQHCLRISLDAEEHCSAKELLWHNVCLPLLQRIPYSALVNIVISNTLVFDSSITSSKNCLVAQLVAFIQKPTPSYDLELFAMRLFVSYELLRLIYDRCPIATVKAEVTRAFAGPAAAGKELTQAICKAAYKTSRSGAELPISLSASDKLRIISSSYICLCVVVAKSQSEESVYENFLFKEKPNEPLWSYVIDQTVTYELLSMSPSFTYVTLGSEAIGTEADAKLVETMLRRNNRFSRAQKARFGLSGLTQDVTAGTLHSISNAVATQSALEATISKTSNRSNESATQFASIMDADFSSLLTPSQAMIASGDIEGAQPAFAGAMISNIDSLVDCVAGFDDYSIQFELNDINRQPCMSTLVRIVLRMAVAFTPKWSAAGDVMPKWLSEVVNRMDPQITPTNSRNTRLFFLRLLINQPVASIVAAWSDQILPALMRCCIQDLMLPKHSIDPLTPETQERGFSYLLRDVVFTITDTWADAPVNNMCINECTEFLNYLISTMYNAAPELLKENVGAVCTLISLWASSEQVNYSTSLYKYEVLSSLMPLLTATAQPTGGAHGRASSAGSEGVRMRSSALKVIKCMLDNKVLLFYKLERGDDAASRKATEVLQAVVASTKFPRQEVVDGASVVIGMITRDCAESARRSGQIPLPSCARLEDDIEVTLTGLLSQKGGLDDGVSIIDNVAKYQRNFLGRDLCLQYLSSFGRLNVKSKYMFLRFLCDSTKTYEPEVSVLNYLWKHIPSLLLDQFTVSEGRGTKRLRVSVVQLFTLRLLNKLASELTAHQMESLVVNNTLNVSIAVTATEGSRNANVLIRREAYRFLIKLFHMTTKQASEHLSKRLLSLILRGLADPDDGSAIELTTLDRGLIDSGSIRSMVYEFMKDCVGIAGNPLEQMIALMTQYFDGGSTDASSSSSEWLKYSTYLLMDSCFKGTENQTAARTLLFEHGLEDDSGYTQLELPTSSSQSGTQMGIDPRKPRFSLENTTQVLSSQSQSQALSASQQQKWLSIQGSLASQFGATQAAEASLSRGFIRSSQQVEWGQTQTSEKIAAATQSAAVELSLKRLGRSLAYAPTQQLIQNGATSTSKADATQSLPAFLKPSITQAVSASQRSASQLMIAAHNTLASQAAMAATQTDASSVSAVSNSTSSGTMLPMAPPIGLPTRFAIKAVIQQRTPHRYTGGRSLSTSTSTSSSDKTSGASSASTNPYASGAGTARKYYSSAKRAVQQRRQDMTRRGAAIATYRSYRTGDLPDIKISIQDFLAPMQELGSRDGGMASALFVSTYRAVYQIVSSAAQLSSLRNNDLRSLTVALRGALGDDGAGAAVVMPKSSELVVALLSCAYHCVTEESRALAASDASSNAVSEGAIIPTVSSRSARGSKSAAAKTNSELEGAKSLGTSGMLSISPSIVVALAKQSGQHYLGISILEDVALALASKANKTTMSSLSHWSALTDLYEAIRDDDIVACVRSKLCSSPETHLAFDAELAGDYTGALTIYNKLLERHRKKHQTLDESMELDDSYADDNENGTESEANIDLYTELEPDMWTERSMECLKSLLDWNQLDDVLTAKSEEYLSTHDVSASPSLPSWVQFVSHPSVDAKQRQRHLNLKLQCLSHADDSHEDDVREFVAALTINDRSFDGSQLRSSIEVLQPNELSACYAIANDWSKSRSTINQFYSSFISQWSTLHRCAQGARADLLVQLQSAVELEDSALVRLDKLPIKGIEKLSTSYASCFGDSSNDRSEMQQRFLIDKWSRSLPFLSDSLGSWAAVVRRRHIFLDELGGAVAADHLSKIHVLLARAAVHQNVLHVVKNQLAIGGSLRRAAAKASSSDGRAHYDEISLDEVRAVYAYNQLVVEGLVQKSRSTESSDTASSGIDKALGMFAKTRGLLERTISEMEPGLNSNNLELHAMKADWLVAEWEVNGDFGKGSSAELNTIAQNAHAVFNSTIAQYSNGSSNNALCTIGGASLAKLLGSVQRRFATLCEAMLESGVSVSGLQSNLTLQAIEAYIKGLVLNDSICRDKILHIFRLIGNRYYSSTAKALSTTEKTELGGIVSQLRSVPAWMYIKHSAQLLGCLDRPEGNVAISALEAVAAKYPFAVHYHFRITSEHLGAQATRLVPKLKTLLHSPVIGAFCTALDGMTHPDLKVADALKEALAFQRMQVGKITQEALKNAKRDSNASLRQLSDMLRKCVVSATSDSWGSVGDKIGGFNKNMAKQMKKFFDAELKYDEASGLYMVNDDTIAKLLDKVRLISPKAHSAGKVPLAEFSQWLAEFDADSNMIEIPGLYSSTIGDKEPIVENHPRIASFDPQVLVMSSIRRPKRLIMIGSDGRSYPFLVKGGEDLRNDDRIEQLFGVMNSIVQNVQRRASVGTETDGIGSAGLQYLSSSGSANLTCRTFGVIPMTSKLGLLEWVNNTTPIKAILSKQLAKSLKPGANATLEGMEASDLRRQWLKSEGEYEGTVRKITAKSIATELRDYNNGKSASIDSSSSSAVATWTRMMEAVPSGLLRKHFVGMSSGPETYYAMRDAFAKSLALNSIFGYILGIGDRHLDNLLLDNASGAIVMIDFGICFGMGASQLPVPELIPFRMTSQLLSTLAPLDGLSVIRHHMIRCLNYIRERESVQRLANELEVYINDPVVDWLRGSSVNKDAIESLRSEAKWEPKRRVDAALSKLQGKHPISVLLDDLASNPSIRMKKLFSNYEVMLHGIATSSGVPIDANSPTNVSTASTTTSGDNEGIGQKRKRNGDAAEDGVATDTGSSARRKVASKDGLVRTQSISKEALNTSSSSSSAKTTLSSKHVSSLTSAQQADVLLGLATSPSVLIRQWEGLLTWV